MKRFVLLCLMVLPVYGYGEGSDKKSVPGLSIQGDDAGQVDQTLTTNSLADKAALLWDGVVSFPQAANIALNKFFLKATEEIQEHYFLSGLWIIAIGWLAKNSYDNYRVISNLQGQAGRLGGFIGEQQNQLLQLRSRAEDYAAQLAGMQRAQDALLVEGDRLRVDVAEARRETVRALEESGFQAETARAERYRRQQAQASRDQAYAMLGTAQQQAADRIHALEAQIVETSGLLAEAEARLTADEAAHDRVQHDQEQRLRVLQEDCEALRTQHQQAISARAGALEEVRRLGQAVQELNGDRPISWRTWLRGRVHQPQGAHAGDQDGD